VTASPPPAAPARLLIATPLYGGAEGDYLRSVVALAGTAERAGVPCTFVWVSNNPVIDRARHVLAAAFVQFDATHLVFIDGDVGFVPDELLGLVQRMRGDDRLAVVGAPYPKRWINWGLVASAAAQGLADGNPALQEKFSGAFPFDLLEPAASFALDQPIEFKHTGTGLMVIRRDVIEGLIARHPELLYAADALDREGGIATDKLTALFQPPIDPASGHMLSDDYAFCHRVRSAGYRIWLAPWMRTSHTGPARFAATFSTLAQLRA
jgi:hypothetical protein